MTRSHTIGLVACSKRKLERAAPAQDLYTSALFRLSRAYVERACDQWAILSAKHGLVMPDQVIEPYDETLRGKTRDQRRDWNQIVRNQIVAQFRAQDLRRIKFILLAGEMYRGPFDVMSGCVWEWEAPLAGMPIGRQLQWLRREAV